jgi:hypothetical protein
VESVRGNSRSMLRAAITTDISGFLIIQAGSCPI